MVWWLLAVLAFLMGTSLWLRVQYYRNHLNGAETRASPLSLAIQELIATAGGIYLAIIGLTSFLKLDVPEKVLLFHVSMDPLALSAIGAAIIQPLLVKMFNKLISG